MLVQALAAYADEYLSDQLSAEAWEEKPVPVLIDIAADGTFLGAIDRRYQETRGKKTITLAQPLLVPKSPVNRNSGLHPLLAADDIKYVLGPGAWTAPEDIANAEERHAAFVTLIRNTATSTGDSAMEACARFYQQSDQVRAAREALKDSKAAVLLALSVGGPVVMRPAVQDFWNEHFRKAFQERVETGGVGECIISGTTGPIAPTHEKIKGIAGLGGQPAGVSLMSFDKAAFRSYGWEQNANSPVCPERAMAYVLALNDLLKSEKGRRRDIAGVGFVYWTRKRTEFDPMAIVEQPIPEQVSALLRLDHGAPDPEMFYMAGLAGNGGRLIVRYWLGETLGQIRANLKGWFSGLSIAAWGGQLSPPPRLWQLRFALDRDGEPSSRHVLALVRRAIEGRAQSLGYDILSALLARLRHPSESKPAGPGFRMERFDPVRLGLLRLCLNDLFEGEKQMTEILDPEQGHPAYVCGRLLAEYENLQETAYRSAGESKINVTIVDRYYSLASTSPAVAFPKIEGLAKSHFRKLRREKPGVMIAIAIERRVMELHEKLGTRFPSTLGLDGQGRFALGYYHQKAERSRQISEWQAAKAIGNTATGEQEQQ